MFLFPRPREIILHGGIFSLPENATLRVASGHWSPLHATAQNLLGKTGSPLRLVPDDTAKASGVVSLNDPDLPSEGYRLEINATGITLRAADAPGSFYGLLTLAQILRAHDTSLPCLTCIDSPDLPVRGFMLDISRGKVPTQETFFTLVEQLAVLRLNQFQLYTEHTFAFPGHEIVWQDASPMTPEELRQLDRHCRAHAIELVPNLQSFGHMERWLRHPPYRHLAECPDGFFHDLLGAHRAPGTLKPNQDSLDFVAGLYDAYLTHFTSEQFNIGGDEPWELGRGWSKPLCDARGRHAVYCEHLKRIHNLVTERGKKMQFWADILLEDPAHAADAPAGAVPVIWGYDTGHPFPAQCATLEKLGCDYLVAPGTSSWQTLHGRLDNALANVNEAIRAAQAHHARGVLVTAWGDNGYHQPWWSFYPALASAAGQAWGLAANVNVDLAQAVGAVFLHGDTATAQCLLDYGRIDTAFQKQIRNKSILWELLFAPGEKLTALLAEVPSEEIDTAEAHAAQAEQHRRTQARTAAGSIHFNPAANLVKAELRAATLLINLACSRARHCEENGPGFTALHPAARQAIDTYRASWLLRARPGGLAESVAFLERAFGL